MKKLSVFALALCAFLFFYFAISDSYAGECYGCEYKIIRTTVANRSGVAFPYFCITCEGCKECNGGNINEECCKFTPYIENKCPNTITIEKSVFEGWKGPVDCSEVNMGHCDENPVVFRVLNVTETEDCWDLSTYAQLYYGCGLPCNITCADTALAACAEAFWINMGWTENGPGDDHGTREYNGFAKYKCLDPEGEGCP